MEIARWLLKKVDINKMNIDGVKTKVLIQHYQDPLAAKGTQSLFTQECVNGQKFPGLPAMRMHELWYQNPVVKL